MAEPVSSKFKLPQNLERYLAALSKVYSQEGKKTKQEILVNAQIRIHEEWTYDNWDGGTYGHALYLVLPEYLYLSVVGQKDKIQDQLKIDINRMHNIPNEHVAQVFLEMDVLEDQDWRKESGLLRSGKRAVLPDSEKRIWGEEGFRLFLSHKSEAKKETAELKERLQVLGVAGFVAHQDIHPTKEWQDEIENALASMDAFVALMTENFHDSEWTDQEVGYALARGVPIIAVRMGKDPYGFIGKFQGLSSSTWEACPEQIVRVLIRNERMISAYIQAVRRCISFDNGNALAKILPAIERLSPHEIDAIVAAYNETSQLQGSFGFNGTKPTLYGRGLVSHLNRLGTRQFKYGTSRLIELAP